MVKDHSDSERGNPLPPHGLLFSIVMMNVISKEGKTFRIHFVIDINYISFHLYNLRCKIVFNT